MSTSAPIADYVGDYDLIKIPTTAFLCSRRVPAGIILKCYDWAIEQREAGNCVISGFHSTIEKDVFHYLLKGSQPIIMALHRGIGPSIVQTFSSEIDAGRLLIISPFERKAVRGDSRTANIRNRLMTELADRVVVGHVTLGGNLSKLLSDTEKSIHRISELA